MLPSSNKPKLLCDENIPQELIKLLLNEGFDVKRVPLGSEDKNIAKIAKSKERLLLTFDKHFLNKLKFPPKEFAGIVFIDIHPPLIDSVYSSLDKLFKLVGSSNFKGRLFNLRTSGFKVFPKF